MANTTNKFQDPRQFLTPMDEEHSHKNRRSAIILSRKGETRPNIIMKNSTLSDLEEFIHIIFPIIVNG